MSSDGSFEMLRASDPARGFSEPTPAELDRVLEHILGRLQPPRAVRHPRRWLRPVALAAVCLSVAGVAVTMVLPAGVQVAWARRVLDRATAFILSGSNKPLYTDVTTITRGGEPLRRVIAGRAVTWQYGPHISETTWTLHPHRREDEDSVANGRRIDIYIAATNTIQEDLNPKVGRIVYSPVLTTLTMLSPPLVQKLHLDITTVAGPSEVAKVMVALMRSPGVKVAHATLRGTPTIRLSDPQWSGVIYLDPITYAPREIYRTTVRGTTAHGSQTVLINAYRTIDSARIPRNLFNLRLRHPTAKIHRNRP